MTLSQLITSAMILFPSKISFGDTGDEDFHRSFGGGGSTQFSPSQTAERGGKRERLCIYLLRVTEAHGLCKFPSLLSEDFSGMLVTSSPCPFRSMGVGGRGTAS